MLSIIFGDADNTIYHPPTYFDNTYEDNWITAPLSVEMIKDVDKSEVVGPYLIQSPVLGPISTKELSGGVKTLILMAFDETGKVFNASACGNNCAKWILKIADELGAKGKKVVINLRHLMDFGDGEFKIRVLNTNKIVRNMGELVEEAVDFV